NMIFRLLKYPLANGLCVRRYSNTLRDSVFSDLKWAIAKLGVEHDFECTVSPLQITRKSTGQKILFRGLDDGLKITSISVDYGVLCFVWVEEAYEIVNKSDFDKLDMSNFVNKKVKNAKMYASRLIMTEQAAFHARSQQDAFNELDIEEFEIVATLDSHTSEICREMDGKHFPMEEYKIGITAPPFHVYCRSVTAPHFNDEWSDGKRAARDENGKTYYVPSGMTYPEWRDKHVIKSNDYTAKTNGSITVSKNITIPEGNDIKKRFGDILDETLNSKESLVKLSIKELEELEYSKDMNAKLSDKDSRMWYDIKVRKILSLIDESKTLEEQAREAFDLRNKYKHQAREMMVDQEKRKRLDMEKDKTFEQLMEEKRVKYGVDGDDVYRQILGSSKRTNKIVNSVLGLEGE
ncbi:MAG: phage terminase large subunit, partial [Clostridiales bacterium]|nr:phage terminase large subunit [Clostridiales bacterium]